jgi:hypothetical protein
MEIEAKRRFRGAEKGENWRGGEMEMGRIGDRERGNLND